MRGKHQARGAAADAKLPVWARYALAAGLSSIAVGLRIALHPLPGPTQPYALFYVSVALTAWWGGLGPAILAGAAGMVAGTFLLLEPGITFGLPHLLAMLTYAVACACFVGLLRYARRAESAAERQQALLEAVLEACPAGVIVADTEGRILRMNPANQRLWGMAPFSEKVEEYREWKGWWADESARHGRRLEPTEWALARSLRGEIAPGDVVEIEPFGAPGVRRTMINCGAPVRDRAGRVIGAVVVQMDITERRKAELELRHRSDQLAVLLGQAPLGVHLVDADFRIAHVNPFGLPAFGDIPHLIGRDFGEVMRIIWPESRAAEIVGLFRRTLNTGEPHHMPELIDRRVDRGLVEYYDWRINRITLPDGRHGVVCYYSDISRQVRAREAIAASEARYRALFNSIDEGFCVLEMMLNEANKAVDCRYIEVNPAFEHQTGMKDALGRTVREIVPEIEDRWIEIYEHVALTGQPTRFVAEAAAMRRWFDVYAFRLGAPAERKVAVLFSDITARKEAEAELARANQKLQSTLDSISDGLLVLDHDWRFTYFSETAARMLGLRVADLMGQRVWDVFPYARASKFGQGYYQAVETRQPVRFEEFYPGPINKWLECVCYPAEQGLSVYFHDITQRKQAEEALAQARNQLERHAADLERMVAERTAQLTESVHELESFSYSISHDMRAPLRAMMGFSQLLETDCSDQLSAEGKSYLRRISTAARRLDQLIQDVLTYSKVARGSVTLQPIAMDTLARQLIDESPALQQPQAEIEIRTTLLPVLAHEAQLAQVLSNLLYNAVKFVAPGCTPRIRLWTEDGDAHVRLYVQDNGIGIPAAAQERIFGMFERLHHDRQYEGTGIGLAIVRKAVERMSGRVSVSSAPGQGSTFCVELRKATTG